MNMKTKNFFLILKINLNNKTILKHYFKGRECDCRNLFGGVAQIYTARRPDACEKTEKRR